MASSESKTIALKTKLAGEQALPASEQIDQLYPPSWVDRFTDWVSRLPVPPWMYYLGLWLFLCLLESGSKWLDGIQPFGKLRWINVFYPLYGVYFLAAIHYSDRWAKSAYEKFRPVLALSEAEQSRLSYELTTMPARTIWLLSAATIAAFIVILRPVIIPLWASVGISYDSTTPVSNFVDLGLISAFNFLIIAIFVYHTLRQLRRISRIHNSAARLNLFQLRPLYSLSAYTACMSVIILLSGYLIDLNTRLVAAENLAPDPGVSRISEVFPIISLVFFSLLAGAVFLLPLIGLHQLLVREKERMQAEADSRLQAHMHDLHQRVDARQFQNADAIHFLMNSLALERDILAKVPTWPWQPGTFNILLTAVLLPIVLWILQQLLERWAGL